MTDRIQKLAILACEAHDLIRENGGCSLRVPDGKPAPAHGYMVAVANRELKVPMNLVCGDLIRNYMIQNDLDDDEYLGGWVDDDICYLDCALHIEDRDEALKLGAVHKQLAIYDLAKEEEIRLNN
jgi:hypothetical protein